jgi:hypothetical protein
MLNFDLRREEGLVYCVSSTGQVLFRAPALEAVGLVWKVAARAALRDGEPVTVCGINLPLEVARALATLYDDQEKPL